MIMEDAFFKAVKANKIQKAKEIYENNHINVMFNDNCVIRHAVKTRKLDVIKWLMQIEDFSEFVIEEEPMSHFISLMTLACRERYYDLMLHLHENYMAMTWIDFNEFLSDNTDVDLVRNVLENIHTSESYNNESIAYAKTREIIELLLSPSPLNTRTVTGEERGWYVINDDILELCENPVLVRYALEKNLFTNRDCPAKILIRSCLHNNVDVMKCVIDVFPDMRFLKHGWKLSMYDYFELDHVDAMEYVDDLGYGIETFSPGTQESIITLAMQSQAVKCVRYFYSKIRIKPTAYTDTYINYEYTKLATEFFDVQFKPKHLMCFDKKLFKFVMKRLDINSQNIEFCLKSVMATDSDENMQTFLNHIDTLPPGVVKREHYGNIFVLSCISNFQDLSKHLIIKHGYVLNDATITKNDMNDEFPGLVHLDDNTPINTPKRLLNLMFHEDESVDIVGWISRVYNIQFKYKHICNALDDTYGANPKMVLFLLENTPDLSFNQLKHVFSSAIAHYENNAYYICKYLIKRYSAMITPHLKSVLFKHAMAFTQQAFRLFEDCEYSVRTCLMQSIYGDNVIAFDYMLNKHSTYQIRQKNDELFRYACSTESTTIVKRMCDIWKDIYTYKIDSDDEIIPLIKDSLEYFVHHGDTENILKKLKKKKVQGEKFECAVCYESANVQTTCQHAYCVTCISQWYTRSHTCPMCKQKFNIKKCLHLI